MVFLFAYLILQIFANSFFSFEKNMFLFSDFFTNPSSFIFVGFFPFGLQNIFMPQDGKFIKNKNPRNSGFFKYPQERHLFDIFPQCFFPVSVDNVNNLVENLLFQHFPCGQIHRVFHFFHKRIFPAKRSYIYIILFLFFPKAQTKRKSKYKNTCFFPNKFSIFFYAVASASASR